MRGGTLATLVPHGESEIEALNPGSPPPRDSSQADSRVCEESATDAADCTALDKFGEDCTEADETSVFVRETYEAHVMTLTGEGTSRPRFAGTRWLRCLAKLAAIVVALSTVVLISGYLALVLTSTTLDYWAVTAMDATRYDAWLLDSQLVKCFNEIPKVPELWGANVPSCPVGTSPPDSFPDHTKRVAVVQYQWALDARPFSAACAAYAKATYEGTSVYCSLGLCDSASFRSRPDPREWESALEPRNLPRITPMLGTKRARSTPLHPDASSPPTSVLLSLYDAMGRGTYHRFVKPAVLAAVGGDFEVFDFTRFHVVGCCSNRNTRAMYGGVLSCPEIAASIRTGVPTPPENKDVDICFTEDIELLRATCQRHMLHGRYFERGYLPVRLAWNAGEYFQTCVDRCAKLTGLAVTGQEYARSRTTELGEAQKVAAAFHSLASNTTAIFATDHNEWAHNADMHVQSSAYIMAATIRSVRKSAQQRGIPLPLMIFFADHGLHFGGAVTHSILGKVERKFPTLVIVAPKALLAANPGLRTNLQRNRQRLVSGFDLHRTLAEFADSQAAPAFSDSLPQVATEPDGKQVIHARNFFESEIPQDRGCADAGIEDRLCGCAGWTFLEAEDTGAVAAAHAAMSALQHDMAQSGLRDTKCSKDLRMIQINTVRRSPSKDSKSLVELVLRVSPGIAGSGTLLSSILNHRKMRQIIVEITVSCAGEVNAERLLGTSCSLVTFERLSSLSPEEDALYKGSTADGKGEYMFKMCVI